MQLTELRIGNWILNDNVENIIVGMLNEKINIVNLKTKQNSIIAADIELIRPIPLAEEWLDKFGFEKNLIKGYHFKECGDYEMRVVINAFSGTLQKDSNWFVSIETGYYSQPVTLIKEYVHQLQNLYFELAEKELEFLS